MNTPSLKPIQEVSALLKHLKKDISELKCDVKYIKEALAKKAHDAEPEIIIQPLSNGWW